MIVSKLLIGQRARQLRLLSRLYAREVDAALLDGLRTLPDGALPLPLADADLTALAVDYAGLFLAAGSADGKAAIPCESLYAGGKHLLMQAPWEDMTRRCQAAGLAPEGGLMADHLSVELAFLAHLIETADQDAQRSFLREHLENWVPRLVEDIRAMARTGFYRALADYTLQVLAQEQALLAQEFCLAPSFSVRQERFANILARLRETYRVIAPMRQPGGPVCYGEIRSLTDIAFRDAPRLDPLPADDRPALLFLRPEDAVPPGCKAILLDLPAPALPASFSAAVRIDDICALFEVCDPDLLPYFADEVPAQYTPAFS